jgi:hypothetical protein
MRYVIAIIFLVCGGFFLFAARHIGRDTHRTRSLIGEIPPTAARILRVGALILGAVWALY